MRTQRRTRTAFTLVELLVAVALTLFLMAIIAEAFGAATKTFGTMRSAGQLQERMRSGAMVIRQDLAAEHLDGPYIGGRGGPRVGDQRMDLAGWVPPPRGYFEIRQFPNGLFPNQPGIYEPMAAGFPFTDGEGLTSSRADTHDMRFTVKLPDLPATELYSAELPATIPVVPVNPGDPAVMPFGNNPQINAFPVQAAPGTPTIVYSRWAEIQYFLRPNGDMTPNGTNNAAQLPLYSLRRRVRLLASTGQNYLMTLPNATQLMAQYPDVAMARIAQGPVANTVILRVLGPEDVGYAGTTLAGDSLRMQYGAHAQKLSPAGVMYETGDDILITDVLSFEVKAAWFSSPTFEAIRAGSSPAVRPLIPTAPSTFFNTEAPFDDIPEVPSGNQGLNNSLAGQRRFDTWGPSPQYVIQPLALNSDSIEWDRPISSDPDQRGFLMQHPMNPPLRINVRAVQIKIRVWDSRKETARQMTIIQEI